MSFFPGKDPALGDARASDAIEHIIVPRTVDLGGFNVHRALPSGQSRMVGPFIFFDHFGPAVFGAGNGVDVRPHPHIGLATVTYLFDGEIVHRDSLGTAMAIRPGAVNWMTAGRGIAHSERTAPERRGGGEPLHGLQLWVALPMAQEEDGAGLRAYASGRHSGDRRERHEAPRRRRRAQRRALAGRDVVGHHFRRRAPQGRHHVSARHRARGARDLRARGRDRDRAATAMGRSGC